MTRQMSVLLSSPRYCDDDETTTTHVSFSFLLFLLQAGIEIHQERNKLNYAQKHCRTVSLPCKKKRTRALKSTPDPFLSVLSAVSFPPVQWQWV